MTGILCGGAMPAACRQPCADGGRRRITRARPAAWQSALRYRAVDAARRRVAVALLAVTGLLACLGLPAAGAAQERFTLANGDAIAFDRLDGGPGPRLMLFPADEGFIDNEAAFARALAAQGLEVVYPQLHDSYFLTPGAYSLSAIPLQDLVGFVRHIDTPDRPLFLLANQRVALIALEVASEYQRAYPGRAPRGIVLLSPYLEAGPPEPGEPIHFHPATAQSNLPLMIFQPRSSSRFYYLKDTIAALERGGSPVFVQVEEQTRDAYHIWPHGITAHEAIERERLPEKIARSLALLASATPAEPSTVGTAAGGPRSNVVHALPQPIAGAPAAPTLRLADLDGQQWTSDDLRGRVLLLNFWATWCPPCIEELPALQRLHQRLQESGFAVVSIDVGEDRQTVERFLQQNRIELGYPVLIDAEGDTVHQWHITGFPTSFLTDRAGRLRYGLIGAIQWDNAEVVELVRQLLAE